MLEATRESYLGCANLLVPEWKNMSKNQLAFDALEHKNDRYYDGYVSALMLKYWGKMTAYYHRCKLVATPEDAHGWLVMAVMYALDNHPWTNPESSIHNDKNGPDKVINRVMESRRVTFYQQLNRYNRKINSALLSLESLSDDWADANTPMVDDEYNIDLEEIVMECFYLKDYFYAFLLDAIIYENYIIHKHYKKIVTHLQSIDDEYCEIFAGRYNLNLDRVKRASSYVTRMHRTEVNERMLMAPKELKKRFKRWGLIDANRIAQHI
jgi:hypothetical protein